MLDITCCLRPLKVLVHRICTFLKKRILKKTDRHPNGRTFEWISVKSVMGKQVFRCFSFFFFNVNKNRQLFLLTIVFFFCFRWVHLKIGKLEPVCGVRSLKKICKLRRQLCGMRFAQRPGNMQNKYVICTEFSVSLSRTVMYSECIHLNRMNYINRKRFSRNYSLIISRHKK